jgi:hypothetical protein
VRRGSFDISVLGWARNLVGFYEARGLVGFDRFLHVQAWLERGAARAASDGGLGKVLLVVELMLPGVVRERICWLGFRLLANELARRESLDLT